MYFADLSFYSYKQPSAFSDVFNVGWLGGEPDYPKGEVSPAFLKKLTSAVLQEGSANVHVNRIRGAHPCNICGVRPALESTKSGKRFGLGSSEVWFPRRIGSGFYAAPAMILHYIADHRYRPPGEFSTSVEEMDLFQPFNAQIEYARRAELAMKRRLADENREGGR
jgi:hypothetical protein